MTFADCARLAAYEESVALRAFARAGYLPKTIAPVDLWAEWLRRGKTSSTTKRAAA